MTPQDVHPGCAPAQDGECVSSIWVVRHAKRREIAGWLADHCIAAEPPDLTEAPERMASSGRVRLVLASLAIMGGEVLAERKIRRRAGASAAAEYARLTREWRQRNRRFFRWGAALCFFVVALALLLGLGELRGWLSGLLAGMTLAFYVLVRETPPAWIGHYLTGAVGEARTAKAVTPLLRAGWFISHDLDRGQFNIDHVLVGPPGVFVLETKNLHGTVVLDGDQATLTRPGRERPDYQGSWWAREGRSHAADANSFFRQRVQVRPWVTAVVVLWADFPQRQYDGDKVTFIHGDDLVTWLQRQPERLRPDQIDRLRTALEPRHRSKPEHVIPAA